MNYLRFTVLILFVICLSSWASPQDGKITAVENGLLPANVFKGDQPWTKEETLSENYLNGHALNSLAELEKIEKE